MGDGVQLGKDLQAHQRCFIDDQHDLELLSQDQLTDLLFDEPDHNRPRCAGLVDMELSKKQAVKLEDGAGSCSDMNGSIL